MSPNLTAIAKEFGFNDEERDKKLGGEIALAFFVLGAPASFVVGCLGDHYNRSMLFAGSVGIGEGACLATYFTRTYPQLYACRAITGFSLGGALPLIYSMLGDLFVAQDRHAVSAVVGIGTGIGISLGQGIAGLLGPRFGWRIPFLIVSIPALICAFLVLLWVEDPPRGAMEEAMSGLKDRSNVSQRKIHRENFEMVPLPADETDDPLSPNDSDRGASLPVDAVGALDLHFHWSSFCNLLSTPTVLLALFQGAPGCIPWGIVNTYLNDFLSQDRGMTVQVRAASLRVVSCYRMPSISRAPRFPASLQHSQSCALVPETLWGFSLEEEPEVGCTSGIGATLLYWLGWRRWGAAFHFGSCSTLSILPPFSCGSSWRRWSPAR